MTQRVTELELTFGLCDLHASNETSNAVQDFAEATHLFTFWHSILPA